MSYSSIAQAANRSEYTAITLQNYSFPNSTLTTNWYSGTSKFQKLKFYQGNLKSIEMDAFTPSTAFNLLHTIIFRELTEFHVAAIAFPFRSLEFQSTNIRLIDNDFLSLYARTIDGLEMDNFPSNAKSMNFFNNNRYLTLKVIVIVGDDGNVTRALDADSFNGLPQIKSLVLRQCGIERIHPNAFQHIGRSLIFLDLSFNKLQLIDSAWLLTFFDTFQLESKFLQYRRNPLNCDCKLRELGIFTAFLRSEFATAPVDRFFAQFIQCNRDVPPLVMCNIQTIRKEKLCAPEMSSPLFMFIKVNLRISNGRLYVRTDSKLKIRIWMYHHGDIEIRKHAKRCPTPEWLRNSTACLSVNDDVSRTIPIAEFAQRSRLITFAAILPVTKKGMWLFHIQTYRNVANDGSEFSDIVKWGTVLTAIFGGFFIGTLLTMGCKRREHRSETEQFADGIRY